MMRWYHKLLVTHLKLTFAKIWIYFAHFEIRQHNLGAARKILGAAIGKCPKDKLFREYIELELQLREFDRCRKLYQKFLEFAPQNCSTWIKFAELETILGDPDRARAIFELAIMQANLDMPEVLWKTFIDFEIDLSELENARDLYRRLLDRTNHPKVWLAFSKFEEDQLRVVKNIFDDLIFDELQFLTKYFFDEILFWRNAYYPLILMSH